MTRLRKFGLALAAAIGLAAPAAAAPPDAALIQSLHRGGYVLVMRHAASPMTPPDKSAADPENTTLERQLDATGRSTAEAMGRAFKALAIPLGAIYSSPTYRARETIRLAGFATPVLTPELGDNGASMTPIKSETQTAWLKAKVNEMPKPGTNTLLVTHFPNIRAAFPQDVAGMGDGEMLVFKPGQAEMVARIKIEDWPVLAK